MVRLRTDIHLAATMQKVPKGTCTIKQKMNADFEEEIYMSYKKAVYQEKLIVHHCHCPPLSVCT